MSEHRGVSAGSAVLHFGLTLLAAAVVGRLVAAGSDLVIPAQSLPGLAITGVGIISVLLFEWRRRRARAGLTTGQMLAQRLADVERRESEVDAVHARLAELEERLDFSERMLAQGTPDATAGRRREP